MAAQFPWNLDNGEKYDLSAGILFSDKITPKFNAHHVFDHPRLQHHVRRHQLSSIDDLAHNFSSLSLLRHQNLNPKPHSHFSNNFERLNPAVRTGALKPQLLPSNLRVNGIGGRERELELELRQRLREYRSGSFYSYGSKPGFDLQFVKPTPAQLERDLKERASRLSQGKQMQNRLLLQQNRNMPFSGTGFEFKGGFLRESGGTGVFHPHPRINDPNTTTATATKKQSLRDRQEIQVIQQRKSTKRPPVMGTNKQNHLPLEIRLPKEWTY